MLFVITNAGIAAVNAAGTGGPLIDIKYFSVGGDFGYTPVATQTALHLPVVTIPPSPGTPPALMPLVNYIVLDNNTVEYTLRMDSSIGDFEFGEIGLWLADGVTLFAVAALDQLQTKYKTSGTNVGSVIEINAQLSFTNISPYVTFPVVTPSITETLELASVDLLSIPSVANSNIYTIDGTGTPYGRDDAGNSFSAIRKDNTYWTFSGYSRKYFSGTVTSSTITSIAAAEIGDYLADFTLGRFIIQFTSGTAAGIVRVVTAQSTGSLSWATSTGTAVAATTTFDVYVSDAYGIPTIANPENVLSPSSTNVNLFRISRARPTPASNGTNTFLVANTLPVTGYNEWIPSDHQLVYDVNSLLQVSDPLGNPSGWVNDSTHVVYAGTLTNPKISSKLPASLSDILFTTFNGTAAGTLKNVVTVEHVDNGTTTEWIRVTVDTPFAINPPIGTPFKLWYPSVLGGSGGGGTIVNGQFVVENFTAGAGGQTNFTTATADLNFSMVFWNGQLQVYPGAYTFSGPHSLTMSSTIPAGQVITVIEITAAPLGVTGVPTPPGNNYELLSTGPAPGNFAWAKKTGLIIESASLVPHDGTLAVNGAAINRTTYTDLFTRITRTNTISSISVASPSVIASPSHGLSKGDLVGLEIISGSLPSPFNNTTPYYVHPVNLTTNSFNLTATAPNIGLDLYITSSSGAVINWTAHGVVLNQAVIFYGTLPTGLSQGTIYYARDIATNTFKVAATVGGAAVTISTSQVAGVTAVAHGVPINVGSSAVGTYSLRVAPWGIGDGTTTFNLPDRRGVIARGFDAGRGLDPDRPLGRYVPDALLWTIGLQPTTFFAGGGSLPISVVSSSVGSSSRGSRENKVKDIAMNYYIYY